MSRFIVKTFAKASSKRRLLPSCIKVTDIAELLAAKSGYTLFPFLGNKSSYRSRQGNKIMPKNHRRARHNMRKQNTFNAEMAEKNNCIVVRIINLINIALMFVTVLFKKFVNTVAYRFIFTLNIAMAHYFRVVPFVIIIMLRIFCPFTRQSVPTRNIF